MHSKSVTLRSKQLKNAFSQSGSENKCPMNLSFPISSRAVTNFLEKRKQLTSAFTFRAWSKRGFFRSRVTFMGTRQCQCTTARLPKVCIAPNMMFENSRIQANITQPFCAGWTCSARFDTRGSSCCPTISCVTKFRVKTLVAFTIVLANGSSCG